MDILNVLGKDPSLERTQVVMYLIGGFHMHIVFFKAMNWTLQQHSGYFFLKINQKLVALVVFKNLIQNLKKNTFPLKVQRTNLMCHVTSARL